MFKFTVQKIDSSFRLIFEGGKSGYLCQVLSLNWLLVAHFHTENTWVITLGRSPVCMATVAKVELDSGHPTEGLDLQISEFYSLHSNLTQLNDTIKKIQPLMEGSAGATVYSCSQPGVFQSKWSNPPMGQCQQSIILISVHNPFNEPGNQHSHVKGLWVMAGHCSSGLLLPHPPRFHQTPPPPPTQSTIQSAHRFPLLHAALLSGQHFNKQSPGNRMLLNGCVLLAGSEQAVYGGACQLLPLGCCSMWKQWRESAFDASPTWFSHSVSLFSLWWEFCEVFFSNRRADLSTPTREEEEQEVQGRRTHTAQRLLCTFLCTFIQCDFCFWLYLGIIQLFAF